MIGKPDISVLLPFYNAKNTLERALLSISNQTFRSFECILINNNSVDSGPEIATPFCSGDRRFFMLNEEKQGIVHALNRGLEVAKGNYIARMDADDWSFPDRLMNQFNFLESHLEFGVVSGTARYMSHKTRTAGFKRYVHWSNRILKNEDIRKKRFVESPLIHPTAMWRKKVSDTYGAYRNGDFPEDYEMWLRWLDNNVAFHKLREPVIKWFDSDYRLTRTDNRYSDDAFSNVKNIYLAKWLETHNPRHPHVVVWGASKISRKRTKLLESQGIAIDGYIDISQKRQLDKQVIYYKDIPSPDNLFILVYLKEETMRSKTQHFLEEKGFQEGKNYLLVG